MDQDNLYQKLNSTNKFCQNGDVSYSKLVESGVKLPSHVSNRLPNNYIVIGCLETEFFEAVQHLNKQDVIGVSLEGSDIGRSGTLEWLNISSSTCTYLFNIRSLGKDAFVKGLKTLLENKRIVKVFHDCRRAADCFYHQYNIKPSNVYDTQVADFVVNAIKKNIELINNKVNSLNYCLVLYLKVPKEYLCEHFKAAVMFNTVPLNHDLLEFFVKNVIYLRTLKQELDMILRMPFRRCIDVYLQVILRKPDHELKLHPTELDLVPPELVVENMQLFEFTENLKPPGSIKQGDKYDPVTRYERDCRKYQQKYGYGKYADDKEFDTGFNYESMDNGLSYSNRNEVVQFLLDRMFAGDSSDRSVISMTPFENLTERDDCSVTSEKDMCNSMNLKSKLSIESERNNLPVSDYTSKNIHSSKNKLSPRSQPLHGKINSPFENPSASDNKCMSIVDVPAVDISLSNDVTLSGVKKPANFKTAESWSSGSSLSGKSLVYKMFAEQQCLLSSQKQLPSKSLFISQDSISDENLLSSKQNSNNVKDSVSDCSSNASLSGKSDANKMLAEQKCLLTSQSQLPIKSASPEKDFISNVIFPDVKKPVNLKTAESWSSGSSLSGKSQIYNIFADQKRLLNIQKQLPIKSSLLVEDSITDVDLFSAKESSNDVKISICDESSVSSLSGKSEVYKMFAEQKRLLANRSPKKDFISDADLLSVEANSNCVKETVCDISSVKTANTSLSDKLKKVLESKNLARSRGSSETGSSTSSNMQRLSMPLEEASAGELNSYKSGLDLINGYSDFSKQRDYVSSDVNLPNFKNNNLPTSEVVQNEDTWTRLRDAFAELGPAKYSTKNVKFIPAGMQY